MSPLWEGLVTRLRGDLRLREKHVFSHSAHIGNVSADARAWRNRYGSTLNFATRLSLLGWQFRFEGNRTIDNPKWGGSYPETPMPPVEDWDEEDD